MRHMKTIAATCTLSLLGSISSLSAADWPNFRGPDYNGISKETGLLKSWPQGGPKRVWLFENAGHGYSGPAIANGKLFTLGTRDGSEVLLILDANTGREISATAPPARRCRATTCGWWTSRATW